MKKNIILKSVLAFALASVVSVGAYSFIPVSNLTIEAAQTTETSKKAVSAPKYVFLFIGDGMSYP